MSHRQSFALLCGGIAIGGLIVAGVQLMTAPTCPTADEAPYFTPETTPHRDHGQRWDARRAWGASQEKKAVDHYSPKGDAVC